MRLPLLLALLAFSGALLAQQASDAPGAKNDSANDLNSSEEAESSRLEGARPDGQFEFKSELAAGQTALLVFTLRNTGVADLHLTGEVLVSAQWNCEVDVAEPPPAVVAAGQSTQFALQVTALQDGAYSFSAEVPNRSADASYVIENNGTVLLLHPGHHHRGRVSIHCSTGEHGGEMLLFALVFIALAVFIQRRAME